ncbi:hypothetical protein DENIS_1413 [Desulfonema ishimotonii]|uniref:Uncharacterized protein n=2 Tax=Desulfonema ishimotonii TaxID=45657 RepID=A0A401FU30_9BACT|nr:hypothetical protein DENIS_1413 [Desulfonema ishimotonii]
MKIDQEMLENLGAKSVWDETGESVEMASLWEEQPTVLVFVRHFG